MAHGDGVRLDFGCVAMSWSSTYVAGNLEIMVIPSLYGGSGSVESSISRRSTNHDMLSLDPF